MLRISRYLDLKLLAGLANVAKVGDVFVVNAIINIYYIVNGKFRLNNWLDTVFVAYVVSGFISFIVGFLLNLAQYGDIVMISNQTKSFVVFLFCLVYLGAHRVSGIGSLYFNGIILTAIIGSVIAASVMSGIDLGMTLFELRGATEDAVFWGWPQRWIVFPAIFLFYCLTFLFSVAGRARSFLPVAFLVAGVLLFLSLIFMSGTRSILIGVIVAAIFMLVHQRRLLVLFGVVALMVLVVLVLQDKDIRYLLADSFRVDVLFEFVEDRGSQEEGSLSNRFYNLWPGIIDSLLPERILFGWGHLGPAFIPESFFPGAYLYGVGSAEGQYMDVLARQGIVGLVLYLALHIIGFIYSLRIYNATSDDDIKLMWCASLYWQVAVFFHGLTVETTRFVFYGLFYFLFLGIVSAEHSRIVSGRRAQASSRALSQM